MREEGTPAIAVALFAGTCGAVQPKINAVLGSRVGSALVASLVNFTVALLLVVLALAIRPTTRQHLLQLPRWRVPRWTLSAGIGGALVVVAGAVAVDTIGVAIFSVAFFSGQVTSSVLVDRFGIAPGGARPLTARRVQAVLLAVVAVSLAQYGRGAGEFAPALVAFVVAAGAAVSFQSAFNARITSATADPVAATAVNVIVGTAALGAVVLAVAAAGDLGPPQWPSEPWLYLGGALGVTIVLSLAVATEALGVLGATLAMLAAQLIAAFGVDWAVAGTAPTAGVVVGGLLIVAAVALVDRRSGPLTPLRGADHEPGARANKNACGSDS